MSEKKKSSGNKNLLLGTAAVVGGSIAAKEAYDYVNKGPAVYRGADAFKKAVNTQGPVSKGLSTAARTIGKLFGPK